MLHTRSWVTAGPGQTDRQTDRQIVRQTGRTYMTDLWTELNDGRTF